MLSAKQLFHAIVIVGAALTASGCGDDTGSSTVDGAVVADARVVDAAVPRDTGADVRQDAIVIIL
jgi:hypothetical protein